MEKNVSVYPLQTEIHLNAVHPSTAGVSGSKCIPGGGGGGGGVRVRHLCFLPLLLLVSLTGRLPLAVMPVVVRPTAPSAMIALAVIILA